MRLERLAVAGALIATVACATHGPVVDRGAKPEGVGGTIAGIVSADRSTPLPGRKVTAIDESTGERIETSTATNGGYTMKVPPGTYRLDVELRAGETLQKRPDPTQVNPSDLDPGRDFIITAATK
jgi:hypothetical protein